MIWHKMVWQKMIWQKMMMPVIMSLNRQAVSISIIQH